MARFRTVAVVVLIVLAGCNAFQGAGSDTPTQTVTPAPVPESPDPPGESTPTSTPLDEAALPPGVSPAGTVDRIRLQRAHRSVLGGQSFTLVWIRGTKNDSQLLWRRTVTLRAGSEVNFSYHIESSGIPDFQFGGANYHANWTIFRDETGVYDRRRNVVSGTWEESVRRRPQLQPPGLTSANLSTQYLPTRLTNVSVVERNGQRLYRLYADIDYAPRGFQLAGAVERYRVTAYVTPDGFIRRVVVSFVDASEPNRVQTVRISHRAIGSTTVTAPQWVAALRAEDNRTSTATVRPASDFDTPSVEWPRVPDVGSSRQDSGD